jgi:capsular exopolysaccharide synthesis family protein
MNENYEDENARKEQFDLHEHWGVLLRRRWTIIAFALPLFIIVTVYSYVVRPTYQAKGTLLIQEEPNILSFQAVIKVQSFMDESYQTQFKLLESRSLLGSVIKRLELQGNQKFAGKRVAAEGDAAKAEDDPLLRSQRINWLAGNFSVIPIPQTRLVLVRFKDHDPKFAATVVNELFEAFIDMNTQLKADTSIQATEFLAKQAASVRDEIEAKERELQKYGAATNIIALSKTETTIIEKLGVLNKALTDAQIERVKKQAYYNGIKDASPDQIPDTLANPLIQRLREDYGRLSREYMKKSEVFKPDYPEMQGLKAELDSAKTMLENETNNLIQTAYLDYQAALKRETSLGAMFSQQREAAIQLDSDAIAYNSLKMEIDNRKSLLEALLKRESETGVEARLMGLKASNIRVVDRAEVPIKPSSPRKQQNMLLALLMGLFGGVGLAFLFERLDSSVKNQEDVWKSAGVPALGIVPTFSSDGFIKGNGKGTAAGVAGRVKLKIGWKGKRRQGEPKKRRMSRDSALLELGRGPKDAIKEEGGHRLSTMASGKTQGGLGAPELGVRTLDVTSIELVAQLAPMSRLAESYRTIRTSLLLSPAERMPKHILISSPLPKEGKSSTLSNLAVSLAQAGKTVLIVDTDFHKPTQHKIFKIRDSDGLTNYLMTGGDIKTLVKQTAVQKLFLICAGPAAPNPAELLGSERMESLIETLKGGFDFMLFDSPPLLTVSDAMVLGQKVDGVILVVWGGKTPRKALKLAKEKLASLKIKTLGVVINNIDVQQYDYSNAYGYYDYYRGDRGSNLH